LQGSDSVVPFLPAHRFAEDTTYRTLGRILSHTVAVTREFPLPICRAAIIGMIYDTTEVAEETILNDFMMFLDEIDRELVRQALQNFESLTSEQTNALMTIFERFDYGAVIKAETFMSNVTLMARNVVCIRPRPLLEKMRSGLPEEHLTHFWSRFHLNTLDVMFRALKPTPERVISRLRTTKEHRDLSRDERRVLGFLKDFIKEMTDLEVESFLHFLTGSKSTPREKIMIEFTRTSGLQRRPIAHTCSNLMELPATYNSYGVFKTEFKNLLASDEAFTMNTE